MEDGVDARNHTATMNRGPNALRNGADQGEEWDFYVVVLSVSVVVVLGTYASGLTIPYYADDFQFYFPAVEMEWMDHFVETGPTTGFYRPLQNAVLTVLQSAFGMNPVPVHLVTLVFHLGTVLLVYEGGRWLGATRLQSGIAAALMAVSQANAAAVLGNDTLSQVASTFFGYLSLRWYTESLFDRQERRSVLTYGGALLSLGAALLFKETGFAFVVLLLLVDGAAAGILFGGRSASGSASLWTRSLSVALLAGAYLLVRAAAGSMGPGFGTEAYQLHIGMNLFRNAALFGAAATSPVSTASVAQWAQTAQWGKLGGVLFGSVLLISVVAYGVYRSRSRLVAVGLLVVAIGSLGPVLVLNDVSELYVYSAMPSLCLVAGIGMGTLWRCAPQGWRIAGGVLLLVYLGSQIAGVRQKATLMNVTGERTQSLLKQLVPVGKTALTGATLCVLDAPTDTTAYSVYRMPGALPLRFAGPVVQHYSSRPDLQLVTGSGRCPLGLDSTIRLHLRKEGWRIERVSETGPTEERGGR